MDAEFWPPESGEIIDWVLGAQNKPITPAAAQQILDLFRESIALDDTAVNVLIEELWPFEPDEIDSWLLGDRDKPMTADIAQRLRDLFWESMALDGGAASVLLEEAPWLLVTDRDVF